MLYVLCDRFGVPLEGADKVSSSSPKLDDAQAFGMQDADGNAINGFLLTIEGSVHRAIADATPSGASMELPTVAEPETKDEIHVPADIEESEQQDEEPEDDTGMQPSD